MKCKDCKDCKDCKYYYKGTCSTGVFKDLDPEVVEKSEMSCNGGSIKNKAQKTCRLDYVRRKTSYVAVICNKCEHSVRILGEYEEEQSEYGEVLVEGSCPFCQQKLELRVDLDKPEE